MIPASFEYYSPTSVDEAVALLREHSDAKVLAGGQSLLPVLRLRLAAPESIVDIGKIDELRGVRDDGDALVIGAMTPHSTVESDPLIGEHARLTSLATATIADPQVRHLGTFGGSLAHADPAGDLPAVAVALDASFVIAGPDGRRTVAAPDFFQGVCRTAGRRLHRRGARRPHQHGLDTDPGDRGRGRADRPACDRRGSARSRGPGGRRDVAGDRPQRRRRLPPAPGVGADPPGGAGRGRRRMKLEHHFVVPTPVEEAWTAFNDLERVVPCFPGA